jgi:hypothetical protein
MTKCQGLESGEKKIGSIFPDMVQEVRASILLI